MHNWGAGVGSDVKVSAIENGQEIFRNEWFCYGMILRFQSPKVSGTAQVHPNWSKTGSVSPLKSIIINCQAISWLEIQNTKIIRR